MQILAHHSPEYAVTSRVGSPEPRQAVNHGCEARLFRHQSFDVSNIVPLGVFFLDSLCARGLRGVEVVTSDAHLGLRDAIATVFAGSSWQRCRPTS